MSLSFLLPYLLKLNRCITKTALIMRQPDIPAILAEGYFRLPESPGSDSLGLAEFLHFEYRPAIFE